MSFNPFVILLLGSLAVGACAQESTRKVRFQLSIAYTNGGDKLASASYTDGSSSSLTAGGETNTKIGLDFRVHPAMSLVISYGSHEDATEEAKNGGAKFKRTPLEGMAYWHPKENHRLGLGFRRVTGATLSGRGAAASLGTWDFQDTTGTVMEWEVLSPVLPLGRGGFSVRYVKESYVPKSMNGWPLAWAKTVDGSHFGLGFAWYF